MDPRRIGTVVAMVGLAAGTLVAVQPGTPAAAYTTSSSKTVKYEAETGYRSIGNVHDSRTIGNRPADLATPLTGYTGAGFLDFSDPVPATDWQGTIPPGQDGASWQITAPKAGNYRIKFVYNNPGSKWGGSRNARDERNMRININSPSYTSEKGWVGWMIFAVSGYNGSAAPGAVQSAATVGGNTAWNTNYMNVPLKKGRNDLKLSMQAPPGQGVYDGPNLDSFEVTPIDDEFVPERAVPAKSGQFEHPGIYYTGEDLRNLRTGKDIPDSVWARGYHELLAAPESSSAYSRPDGYFEVVERGPYNNPDVGSSQFAQDAKAVHYNALRWYLTGDQANAKKAIEILNGWSRTLKRVTNNDAKLIVAMAGPDFLSGAELIKHLYNKDSRVKASDRWAGADMKRFDRLVRSVFYNDTIGAYYPQANGNWDSLIAGASMAIGVYLDDQRIFNQALNQYYRGDNVANTLSMGTLPSYIYRTGESQESNRDQGHAGMGLEGFGYTSEIALNQGIDVFGAYGSRLLTGALYYARYNTTEAADAVESETFISDKLRGAISKPVFEILANYYASHGQASPKERALLNKALDEKYRPKNGYLNAMLFQDAPPR